MRYYFDIRDDHYAADDQEGTALGGNDAAWQEAIKTATMIAGDVFIAGGSAVTVTVRNSSEPIFAIRLSMTSTNSAPVD
jgi:hypothetical protein